LRPGRFDREVVVEPPDRRGREAILRIHTRGIPLAPDVDLGALAQATPGMSGADLANLANEAALSAARRGEQAVSARDFEAALDRITLGAEGPALMDEQERRLVAYHEGGHALVAFMLPNVDPIHRVTITPRGRSLGVTQPRPLDDLQQVTHMARVMVTQLGMADELGPIYLGGRGEGMVSGTSAPGAPMAAANAWEPTEYSDETARRIDTAVQRRIAEAHERARAVLRENRAALDAIAEALVREESLDREELTAIINAPTPPGTERPADAQRANVL
jgi:cell division protease FtsH